MLRRIAVVLLLASLTSLGGSTVARAIMIAPHAVFLNHRTRSAVFYIHNPSETAVEASVDLIFGYPTANAAGEMRVALIENPGPQARSAAQWIKALPRRVEIEPGGRQAIRLLAQPPPGLEDGEYWSRIVVQSQEVAPATPVGASGGVQTALTVATRTITALYYRKGTVATGVRMNSLEAGVDHRGGLFCRMGLSRMGTAAYLGRMDLELTDEAGELVQSWDRYLAVYYEHQRVVSLDWKADGRMVPGKYYLTARLVTDRSDLPADMVLRYEPVVRTAEFVVPATGAR